LTILGRISIRRRWWHSPTDGSVACLDDYLTPAGDHVSVGVREMLCRINNGKTSLRQAAADLARTAQVKMSSEQLRQLVEAEGGRVLRVQDAGEIEPGISPADCEVAGKPGTTRIDMGMDGVMIPIVTDAEKQKRRENVVRNRRQAERAGKKLRLLPPRPRGADQGFQEFKTIVFFNEANTKCHVLLSRRLRTQMGAIVKREARRVRFQAVQRRIANVDGASWIPPQLEAAELRLHGLGLDFYHLSENVHRARRQVYGEENEVGRAWVAELLHAVKHQGYEAAYESLQTWQRGLRGNKRAAATRLLNYVVDRRDMINYPEFRSRGWQYGSGPTEARCKTSTARLKNSGQRWNSRSAEQVAALSNLFANGQWETYWASQKAATP
jgi:hypothetical protein